jgi:thymidylate synthase (FAD)
VKLDFTSEIETRLVEVDASDDHVVRAMLVSTQGEMSTDAKATQGRINFLMKHRHGTPFEHNYFTFYVAAPIFVFREFHRHRIGWCLAGDTEVWCETISANNGRTLRKRPIGWLWENWHNGVKDSWGRVRRLNSCRGFTVRTLDEETGRFVLSRVVDIYQNGEKPLLEVRTDHGEEIRLSGDHAVWTPDGWAKIGDLNKGDLVARNGKVPLNPTRQYPPSLRAGIGVWTSMQRNNLILPVDQCVGCGELFDREQLVLDHIIPVVLDLKKALDPENLAPMCEVCHRAKTNKEQEFANRGQCAGVAWTPIVGMRSVGKSPTYDLELEGPYRGFVANGLVVHNSYNEESGRYKQLDPKFYVPGDDRALAQVGKPGAYHYVAGDQRQREAVDGHIKQLSADAYRRYVDMLDMGVAKEVARMVLPVNIFSSMYATCNARSLMAFLSLRQSHEEGEATFPSTPMKEINMVADAMAAHLAYHMPLTHDSFVQNGYVSP